jgi:hypothetical protein
MNRYTYTQPVPQFAQNDLFVIKIPIFNRHGIIDHSVTKFNKIIYEKTPQSIIDIERSAINTKIPFDEIRSCELESMVHMWKNIKNLSNTDEIDDFKKILQKYFKIIYFNYDIANSYMFKIKLQANIPGTIKKNKYLLFNLVIRDSETPVSNDINALRLLNTINERYELRVGDILYLYLKE